MATATDQTTMLEAPQTPKDLEPIRLRTSREMQFLTVAVEHRTKELEKLSKETRAEGYDAAARVIDGDVDALKTHILPQIRNQRELPLATVDEIRAGIANAISGIIRAQIVVRGTTADSVDRMKNVATATASDQIAAKVESLLVVAIQEAYHAGFAARQTDPHAIAQRALKKLYE